MENNIFSNRYVLNEKIGSGGFAIVYKAFDTKVKQYRAVKVCSCLDRKEAFLDEALLLSSLMHPYLPRVYDILEEEKSVAMVMDYIEGKTLEQYLSEQGAFSPDKAREVFLDLCAAIKYLHSQTPEPLLHRDIKPQNLMIGKEGQVYLLDFGSTRKYSGMKVSDTEIITTLPYSAPEVLQGAQTDVRSDIYAMGLLFFMMLTGYTNPAYARDLHYREKCPPNAQKIIDKCIAIMPFERYESVHLLEKDIRAFSNQRGDRKESPRRWLRELISLGLVVIAGFLGFFLSTSIENQRFSVQTASVLPSEMNPNVKNLIGKTIYLKAFNEQYLQLDSDHNNHFFANTNSQNETTQLTIEDAGSGFIAIKSSNGMYLTAPKAGKGAVAAVSKTPIETCRFQMAYLGKKDHRLYFSLKSINGYFLSSDIVNSGYASFKSETFGGGWETFYMDDEIVKK